MRLLKPSIFTKRIAAAKIIAPPVAGCQCMYCTSMRDHGHIHYTSSGWESAFPALFKRKKNEYHNPENGARKLLRELLGEKEFLAYLKTSNAKFQGASGVWYISGDITGRAHWIWVYMKYPEGVVKHGYSIKERWTILCLPARMTGTMTGCIAAQVLGMKYPHTEEAAWATVGRERDFDALRSYLTREKKEK